MAALLEEAEEDLLAFYAFPAGHWPRLRYREIGRHGRRRHPTDVGKHASSATAHDRRLVTGNLTSSWPTWPFTEITQICLFSPF